jgi:hypothetical protein
MLVFYRFLQHTFHKSRLQFFNRLIIYEFNFLLHAGNPDSHGDTSQAIFFERILSCGWKQKACDTKQFNIKPNRQKKRFPALKIELSSEIFFSDAWQHN